MLTQLKEKFNNFIFKQQQQNFEIQIKTKSIAPATYSLKTFLFIKKHLPLKCNFFRLPSKKKNIIILRSPFVYKTSRLKFTFSTLSNVIYLKLKFLNSNNFGNRALLKFLLKKIFKNNFFSAYSIKKIITNYNF